MTRIRDSITAAAERGEKALGVFLTSGFPDPPSTLEILTALDRAGADFLELGMPFSDPLAEGLPIQRSSERALRHGIRLEDTLNTARSFREASNKPILLMGYINPIYRYGVSRFCRNAVSSGVDGLILPDLPLEEGDIIRSEADAAGLSLVHLIAPNTPDDRVRRIDHLSTGFVYAVSVPGITGTGLGSIDVITNYLARARSQVVRNPLLVGFGIKSYDDAVRLTRHTDGFIVGTAIINLVERLWDEGSLSQSSRLEAIGSFVRSLKHGREAFQPS